MSAFYTDHRSKAAWYEGARAIIMRTYGNGMDRLAAVTLLDAVRDVKRLDNSGRYLEALVWFMYPHTGSLTLYNICDMLNLKVSRVQKLISQIHIEGVHE